MSTYFPSGLRCRRHFYILAKATNLCELVKLIYSEEVPIYLFCDLNMTNVGSSFDGEEVHKPELQNSTSHERKIIENFVKFYFHRIIQIPNQSECYLDKKNKF